MPSQPKAQTTLPTTTTTTSPTFQKLSAKASAGMAYNKIVIYKNEDGNFFAVEFKTPKLYLNMKFDKICALRNFLKTA